MTCKKDMIDDVYFVRWEMPTVSDVQAIIIDVAQAHVARTKKLTYIGIIPEDCAIPEGRVRDALTTGMNATLNHCDRMFLIIEGGGFKSSIMRSVMAAIFLAGGKRERVSVHKSLDHVVAAVHGHGRSALKAAIDRARERGIVTNDWTTAPARSNA